MKTVIVTRHGGLVEWLAARGITGEVIQHVENEDQVRGAHVIGALPIHLAAKAAAITVVDLPHLPVELRNEDLTSAQLDAAGAELQTYTVFPAVSLDDARSINRDLLEDSGDDDKIQGIEVVCEAGHELPPPPSGWTFVDESNQKNLPEGYGWRLLVGGKLSPEYIKWQRANTVFHRYCY